MKLQDTYEIAVENYRKRTPKSGEAYEEACKVIAGGETRSIAYFYPYPFTMEKGHDCKIYDLDGNEYIDFISNYTSLIHGHAHPDITKAIAEAAAKGTASPVGIPEQVKLAKIICARVPGVDKVRFCNSGTEATMFAIRVAKAFKKRDGIIKMLGAYHGTHDIVEFSVDPKIDSDDSGEELKPIPDQPGVALSVGKDVYIAPFNNLQAVEDILQKHAKNIACIIVEPFLGTGLIPAKPGYLQGLRAIADKYDVLLIIDEVQGLRLSTGGAQKKYNVTADISSFGKIIGGGLPVGAFGGREEIMCVFDHNNPNLMSQSGTFNGNRPTMAAGIVAMNLLTAEKIAYLDELAKRLEDGFMAAIRAKNLPMSTTRDGSLLNIHLSREVPTCYATAYKGHNEVSKLWYLTMVNQGVFPAPRGMFVTSTAMSGKEIDETIAVFTESLDVIAPFL